MNDAKAQRFPASDWGECLLVVGFDLLGMEDTILDHGCLVGSGIVPSIDWHRKPFFAPGSPGME
jgi:hypothetical protein